MILAAIDIGSNAIRLLISEVELYKDGTYDYSKLNLIRVPIRLGEDVFVTGVISHDKQASLLKTMTAFKALMEVHQVQHYKTAATSALRDATNGTEIVQAIKQNTQLDIRIINGKEEADIIYANHSEEALSDALAHLYIDVGGGSTELNLFYKGEVLMRESFNIGTVRMLNNKVADSTWSDLKKYVKEIANKYKNIDAIGTGGNINKLHSMSKRKDDKPLRLDFLQSMTKTLKPLSVEERMHNYNLKHDRADVIVPALEIYTAIMEWAKISDIYVPKKGVADGLIRLLHQEILEKA
jgi:exopolyphosphatase / guanosine-5'-triphosphate,3'-diphosphate pyrophosphatase